MYTYSIHRVDTHTHNLTVQDVSETSAAKLLMCPPRHLHAASPRNARAKAIQNHHMAVVNAQTISDEELQASKFTNYKMGGLEQYHLTHLSSNHRLIYFPHMESSEILVFKQGAYDVSQSKTVVPLPEPHKHHILHTAFLDPTAPRSAIPRKAICCPGVLVVLKQEATCAGSL